ncbi:MAG: DUF3108 domain-containing protein, partial [Acetobacteraceae bacterium]
RVHLSYAAYAAGFRIADVEVGFTLEPATYRVELAHRTTGMIGFFFRGNSFSVADGVWQSDRAQPHRYRSQGVWRGTPRLTLIDYERGQPVVRQLVPPNDEEREPVPPQLQKDTIDTLSAMASLVRTVRATGRCDGSARLYDGRRASEITARTAGQEIVPITSRSVFAGQALRCDVDGRMLAGYMRSDDRDAAARPIRGTAWLADAVPGAPKLPVQLAFHSRWLGEVTLYLRAAGPSHDGRIVEWRSGS